MDKFYSATALAVRTIINILFPKTDREKRLESLDLEMLVQRIKIKKTHQSIIGIFPYSDRYVKDALLLLKTQRNERLINLLAKVVQDCLLEELAELAFFENFSEPIVIPIPLSPGRLAERGFNQTALLAAAVAKNQMSYFDNILKKSRETKKQSTLTKKDRTINVAGSFFVSNPKAINKKSVILFDDVTTTGSTLLEARRTLLKSGAKKVLCFSVAYA